MNGGGRTLEIFTIPYYFCKVFPLQFSEQKAQKEEKCFWKKNLKLSKIFLYQKIFQITFHQNFSSVLFFYKLKISYLYFSAFDYGTM